MPGTHVPFAPPRLLRAGATLALGLAGALAGLRMGLPAPALLGSTLAVAAASLAGAGAVVPDRLRDAGFATVGVSLGSGLTPAFWSDLARWPLSLLALCLTMLAIMALSTWMLVGLFGLKRPEALLGSTPGALSYALALGVSGGYDMRPIMVLQSLRLLLITLGLPLVLGLSDDAPAAAQELPAPAGLAASLASIAAAWIVGRAGAAAGLPASYFLAGILASGALHVSGAVAGGLPPALVFGGFAVLGCVIGGRLAIIPRAALVRHAGAAVAVTLAASGVAALAALAVARLVGMPFGQVWIAFAPGGVEAMAAMALALGYDPAFVAVHHLVRILFLIAVLPLAARLLPRRGG